MTTIYWKDAKQKEAIQLEEFAPNSWIHVEHPSPEELQILQEEFSLAENLLQDAMDFQEVPRIEQENGDIYIFTRYVSGNNEEIQTLPLLIIIKENAFFTIAPDLFPRMQLFLEGKIDFVTSQKNKLLLQLFDQINDTYNDYLNAHSKKIRNLSVRVEKIKNKDIIQFVQYESVLFDFNSSLVRINTLFTNLLTGKFLKFKDGELNILEDLSIDIIQHIQITKENLQSISSIREAYSTIMTNNLNRVIKLFTSLTVILTIPTIIGSFYGMNVRLPFESLPMAFSGIVLSTVVLCCIALAIFYYKDWL